MDIDDIRRENIRLLQDEAGSPSAIADRVGMAYAQYMNARDGARDAKTGKRRGIRKETAARFEAAFNKPEGWLSTPHCAPIANQAGESLPADYLAATNVRQIKRDTPLLRELADYAEKMSDRGLILLIEQAAQISARYPRQQANRAS